MKIKKIDSFVLKQRQAPVHITPSMILLYNCHYVIVIAHLYFKSLLNP
jgi:hypothetical protein